MTSIERGFSHCKWPKQYTLREVEFCSLLIQNTMM